VSVVAVVPARGGSKGIAGKNLVRFGGKPLILHSLEAARLARSVDQILVTTDNDAIAEACEQAGFPVPFRRSPKFATDTAAMVDVVLEALSWLTPTEPSVVVLLQPTSPLRSPADIDGTVDALRSAGVESALSVHEMVEHPSECVKETDGTWNYLISPPPGSVRRQDYRGGFYFINGAVYAATPQFIRQNRVFALEGARTALYKMPALRGLDVDTPADLVRGEAILSLMRSGAIETKA
jgi:CMP-N-acetylneuraminic acid synthetase